MHRCTCPEEDCDGERLWTDFESCAKTITRLFRDPSYYEIRSAAAATTQLYKNGVEAHRKAFQKGFEAGRKELNQAYGQNLFEHNRTMRVGRPPLDEKATTSCATQVISSEGAEAVQFIHEALCPDAPQRLPLTTAPVSELTEFLSSQIASRKRQRSPSSPSSISKKLRKM